MFQNLTSSGDVNIGQKSNEDYIEDCSFSQPNQESVEPQASPSQGSTCTSKDQAASTSTASTGVRHKPTKRFKSSNIPGHIQNTINTLQTLKEDVSKMDKEDEFSFFGKNVACQLRQLPLVTALQCQSEILNMIQEKRIASLMQGSIMSPVTRCSSSTASAKSNHSEYENVPFFMEIQIPPSLSGDGDDMENSRSVSILEEASLHIRDC